MRAVVDRLSQNLECQYSTYLNDFSVQLWSEAGQIEFRCEFALQRDFEARSFTIKVPAVAGETDDERELLIVVVFEEIEHMIDDAIADEPIAVN